MKEKPQLELTPTTPQTGFRWKHLSGEGNKQHRKPKWCGWVGVSLWPNKCPPNFFGASHIRGFQILHSCINLTNWVEYYAFDLLSGLSAASPPSTPSWGPIIHSDFDCAVILWLWIIGHYSRNCYYILLIGSRRIYSNEGMKDLQVASSHLL
jgi:hypothetical protein